MSLTADQFGDSVVKAGLASAAELESLWRSLPSEGRPPDGDLFASLLVDRGQLTKFQARRLLQGQGDGLVLGEYVILDTLGAGGMGQVFKARHRRMKRLVAIKLLPPSLNEDATAIRRFEREVEAAAKLTHPNIVVAHDAGSAKNRHFLVMEYVDGTDLSSQVKQHGPLSVPQALDCILQAACGLAYAHEQGVVHRDIKPANLLLDRKGVIKVLDMGLARLDSAGPRQDDLTGTGQIMGTVDYMAPEQARQTKHADARADIYSLGITLWYLVTGKPAYDGESALEKLLAHQTQPIPSLSAACPRVPASLEVVFAHMVAKRLEDRIPTMVAVIAELEACVAEIGVATAKGPGAAESLTVSTGPDAHRTSGIAAAAIPSTLLLPASVIDETITLASAEVATDPETQKSLPVASAIGDISPVPQVSRTALDPWWRHRGVMATAAGVAVLILLTGIITTITSKNGTTSSRSKIAIEQQGTRQAASSVHSKTGWYGWPPDAPLPAVAPFDAEQARRYQEEWALYLNVPVEYANSLGMKFILVPPGEFTMGSTPAEIEAVLKLAGDNKVWQEYVKSEAPRHKVILTQPIYVGVYEVSQKEYQATMGTNPSHFTTSGSGKEAVVDRDTSTHPVELVSWNDAAEFCEKLSQREKLQPFYSRVGEGVTPLDGTGYRLLTEAEWEFSCRAGTTTTYWFGEKDDGLAQAGWFSTNSGGRTHAVGELQHNPFGLYDINGNTWEWLHDWWEPSFYGQFQGKSAIDPSGPSSAGSWRAFRGGDWRGPAFECRASLRNARDPTFRFHNIGFRVSLMVDAVRQTLGLTGPVISAP